jgi:4-hydroxythreonine-4-phosphate dehydrogenase
MSESKVHLAVTLGDPGGIGPEVIVKALSDQAVRSLARFTILGTAGPLRAAAHAARITPMWSSDANAPVRLVEIGLPGPFEASANLFAGEASFTYCTEALRRAKLPARDPERVDGVVTGPINKEAWHLAGHRYPGHTELFAEAFGVTDFGMFFEAPTLRVILATVHVPLAQVPTLLTKERILRSIRLGAKACQSLGISAPRIAVCGVNPHAGEHGVLGTEDDAVIAPAIHAAQQQGLDARGPYPGDTVFLAAMNGAFDLVVAMYHDQGLIPVKLLSRDHAVNVTVGLPIVRTSPDHGTAFDIVGQNRADAGSMIAAIRAAARLATARA